MQQLSPARPAGMERPVSLSEVLDRVLNKGVMVAGEVVISVAGIDLVYLGLNLILTSVGAARKHSEDMEISNGSHTDQ
jgi:hypothetical protein